MATRRDRRNGNAPPATRPLACSSGLDRRLSAPYTGGHVASTADDYARRTALVVAPGLPLWGRYVDYPFIDVHMPDLSGPDLARLLTARRRWLPVVTVTARSDLSIDAHAAASGAICLLRKPFESNTLIDCLKKALKV